MSVERLKRIVESNREQRERDEDRTRAEREREREISDAPEFAFWPFFCGKCRLDFEAVGHKGVNRAYSEPIAWYEAKCPKCRKRLVRRITDRSFDPYWHESRKVNEDRMRMAKDLLQPGDRGFDMAYPEHRRRIEAELERNERDQYDRERAERKFIR